MKRGTQGQGRLFRRTSRQKSALGSRIKGGRDAPTLRNGHSRATLERATLPTAQQGADGHDNDQMTRATGRRNTASRVSLIWPRLS